ncbi:MAG: hypothetical protein Q4C70_04260 [Planctomycetia bacterium]|nr:hypothetical protein [Planctomycetia bacterium]
MPRDFDQYNPDDETVRALARLLWSDRTAVVDSSAQVDEIPIEPDTIAGYHSLKIDESNWKGGASILYTFRLDTNRVESSLETPAYLHPRTFKDVISVNIYVGPNQTTEDLLVASIKADMTSRMLGVPLCIPYYQLKHGPGDVCLVLFSCDSDPDSVLFSDQTVEMYRGNVRVTLRSSYKNFGCMDLAYRLDAYLIEQFEKAKQEREAKTETP